MMTNMIFATHVTFSPFYLKLLVKGFKERLEKREAKKINDRQQQ